MLRIVWPHAIFYNLELHMTFVPSMQTCYEDVAVLHLLKLFQHSNLSWWFPLIHESYAYDVWMLFVLCYVYFDAMPLVSMYTFCSIFVSCLQHVIILTLLMHMLSFHRHSLLLSCFLHWSSWINLDAYELEP